MPSHIQSEGASADVLHELRGSRYAVRFHSDEPLLTLLCSNCPFIQWLEAGDGTVPISLCDYLRLASHTCVMRGVLLLGNSPAHIIYVPG